MTVQASGLKDNFVIVDLDTGTIVGTNLVAVPAEKIDPERDYSDSEIVKIAKEFSYPLYADIYKFH